MAWKTGTERETAARQSLLPAHPCAPVRRALHPVGSAPCTEFSHMDRFRSPLAIESVTIGLVRYDSLPMKTTALSLLVLASACSDQVDLNVDLAERFPPGSSASQLGGPAALDELAWSVTDSEARHFLPQFLDWTTDGGLVAAGMFYVSPAPGDEVDGGAYVARFAPDGSPVWSHIISRADAEALARSSGYLVDGDFSFSPMFDSMDTFEDGGVLAALRLTIDGNLHVEGHEGEEDWTRIELNFLLWYEADGSLVATRAFSNTDPVEGINFVKDVVALPDGGALLSGALPVPSLGEYQQTSGLITRFDAAGERLWTTQVVSGGIPPVIGIPRVGHINLTPDGGIVFGGEFFGDARIDGKHVFAEIGLYVARLEQNGTLTWMRTFDDTAGSFDGLVVGSDGNLLAAGSFATHVSAGGLELENVPVAAELTPFLAEMDPAGSVLRLNEIEPLAPVLAEENQAMNTVMAAAGDEIAIVGGTNEFDQTAEMGSVQVSAAPFVALYDRDGRIVDERRMAATPPNPEDRGWSNAVAISSDGHLATGGMFMGALDFGRGPVQSERRDLGDGYIAVYEPPPGHGVDVAAPR
jgi:hypothetical protein